MLEDCLIESRQPARSKKPLTLVVSVITHGSLVAALVLVPLFQEQLLPHAAIFDPLRPPEARSQVIDLAPAAARQASPAQAAPAPTALIAPREIPINIADIEDEPIVGIVGVPPGQPGRNGGNGPNIPGLPGPEFGTRVAVPPPPPPPSPPPAPPKVPDPPPPPAAPIRKSSGVVMSNLVHQVQPVYPVLAQKTHTQGVVLLEAVIMRNGTIDPARIRVITGNVLLNEAAIEAVKQWRYKPTLLSGEPVEIVTTITINFTFN
jgi:protein TonB